MEGNRVNVPIENSSSPQKQRSPQQMAHLEKARDAKKLKREEVQRSIDYQKTLRRKEKEDFFSQIVKENMAKYKEEIYKQVALENQRLMEASRAEIEKGFQNISSNKRKRVDDDQDDDDDEERNENEDDMDVFKQWIRRIMPVVGLCALQILRMQLSQYNQNLIAESEKK